MDKKLVILVDGSGYLYRAFHALPPLTNLKGEPTGAIFGVLNMLKKLSKLYPDGKLGVFFDPSGKTQRHDVFPSYKENRASMPEDLKVQIEPLKKIIKAQGYPVFVQGGQEADDVIGTIAAGAVDAGFEVVIATGDKDFAQLVSDKITLIDTMYNKVYKKEDVVKKFGVVPSKIIDFLSLVGDSADNIPGVVKVGPKTALKWLESYNDLKGVIDNAENVSGKIGENLRDAVDVLPLYKELVTINCSLSLPFSYSDINQGDRDFSVLEDSYSALGFKSLLEEVSKIKPKKKIEYKLVIDYDELSSVCDFLQGSSLPVSIVLLQDSSLCIDNKVYACALTQDKYSFYIPFCMHKSDLDISFLSWEKVCDFMGDLLRSSGRDWIITDAKDVIRRFLDQGIMIKGKVYDVKIMSYVVNGPGRLSFSQMVSDYLHRVFPDKEDIFGKGAKEVLPGDIILDECASFLVDKALCAHQIYNFLKKEWQKESSFEDLYEKVEGPLIKILAQIEQKGVAVDVFCLAKQSQDLHKELIELRQEIYSLSGFEFNLSSPKQLQEVLFERIGLPIIEKTPKGQPSTSESVLQILGEKHSLPRLILSYRGLFKLKSTYVDALPKVVDVKTSRVHCNYRQDVTVTGRLSCQDPNLQNIPIRTEGGRKVRKSFVAADGFVLVGLDYSQIELRIMAHMSKDDSLLKAFSLGHDVHCRTASDIFSVDSDKVTREQRRYAKVINFGLIYGMSAFGLAKQLGVSNIEASQYIDKYFERYPKVKQYMEDVKKQAFENYYVETLLGRRVYLPDIRSSQKVLKKAAERAAINAPMQGTASDIIKLAMCGVADVVSRYDLEAFLILQVHDELVFEVAENKAKDFQVEVKRVMENIISLDVPLIVDANIGSNWDDIH